MRNDVLTSLCKLLSLELQNIDEEDCIRDVGLAPLAIIACRPEAVLKLAHQKLHAFPFKDVPTSWRRLYEDASLWKVLRICEGPHVNKKPNTAHDGTDDNWITMVIATLDMALILTGAPGRADLINVIFEFLASALTGPSDEPAEDWASPRPKKRQRLESSGLDTLTVPSTFPRKPQAYAFRLQHPVLKVRSSSLESFKNHMHVDASPIILTNTLNHWPALERWSNPQYWLRHTHGGRRLVPVEIGRSYTDEGWGQRICPFKEFLEGAMLRKEPDAAGRETVPGAEEEKEDGQLPASDLESDIKLDDNVMATAYLAQHDLLTQIPALRADIAIPDYCYISPPDPSTASPLDPFSEASASDTGSETSMSSDPSLNIWLGPSGTISPAHTDPHHNLLAQVFGRKYVRLFGPRESEKMYSMSASTFSSEGVGGVDMHNTSRVDVGLEVCCDASGEDGSDVRQVARDAQRQKFPLFREAKFVEAVLGPGEVLYIPRGWWHYVQSLEASCSVSFWWD